jgi:hypothetical protein
MGILSKKLKEVYRLEFTKELKDIRGGENFCKVTEAKIINHLFGDSDYRAESEFKLVHKYSPYIKTKWWQRLNRLWVYPIFLCTLPLQWIIRGETGVETESDLGVILTKLIGNNW